MRNIEVEYDEESHEYLVIDNDAEQWLATFRDQRDAERYADQKILED